MSWEDVHKRTKVVAFTYFTVKPEQCLFLFSGCGISLMVTVTSLCCSTADVGCWSVSGGFSFDGNVTPTFIKACLDGWFPRVLPPLSARLQKQKEGWHFCLGSNQQPTLPRPSASAFSLNLTFSRLSGRYNGLSPPPVCKSPVRMDLCATRASFQPVFDERTWCFNNSLQFRLHLFFHWCVSWGKVSYWLCHCGDFLLSVKEL